MSDEQVDQRRRRSSTTRSSLSGAQERPGSIGGRLRRMSTSFQQSDLPEGFLAATGNLAASVVSAAAAPGNTAGATATPERDGSQSGNSVIPSMRNTVGVNAAPSPSTPSETFPSDTASRLASADAVGFSNIPNVASSNDPEQSWQDGQEKEEARRASSSADPNPKYPSENDSFDNGYHFPPSRPWKEKFKVGSVAFWGYIRTPVGLFVVIYGLLVVAWGGMLFLLLCNAAPAMCYPDCNDINSPRRVWVEIDSQIVNALFCLTGFGLAPWRFRDMFYLLKYRCAKDEMAIRRLAGIHRGWFRLQGSEVLAAEIGPQTVHRITLEQTLQGIPYPESRIPDAPLTGIRAPPTKLWKADFVVYMFVMNTCFQVILSVFMWSMNRFDRPSWTVGLFVCLGMVASASGGIMIFIEGKAVKGIEGVPVSSRDLERLARDKEMGIAHYNNIKDKKPKGQQDKLSIHHRLNSRHVET